MVIDEEIKKVLGSTFHGLEDSGMEEIQEFLSNIPEDKRKDKNFISMLIRNFDYDYVEYWANDLDDPEIDPYLVKRYHMIVKNVLKDLISEDFYKDEEFFLDLLGGSTSYELTTRLFQHANPDFTNNKEFVLKAVKKEGFLIQSVSEQFKNDPDVILEALKSTHNAILLRNINVSEELKSNKEFMIKAVQNSNALKYASESLRADKDVVLEAVKFHPSAINYASEDLRKDKEFMMEILQCSYFSGLALEGASEELKTDRDVVLVAVKNNGGALHYASEDLRNDKGIVLTAIRQDGDKQRNPALRYASEELQRDREVVLEALKYEGWLLQYLSEDFKNDREIVLQAAKWDDGRALKDASSELKNDEDFLLEIARQNPNISDNAFPAKFRESRLFLWEVAKAKEEYKNTEKQDNSHDISEVVDSITDRKTEDINKVVSEISEEMKDETKDNEQTINN